MKIESHATLISKVKDNILYLNTYRIADAAANKTSYFNVCSFHFLFTLTRTEKTLKELREPLKVGATALDLFV